MGCVNKSSKEFKNLITKHNVDGNQLELIVHKYWLETGNETLFPTDIYIQKELGDDSYVEPSKNVRKLWGLRYSTSKEYRTLSDAERAYKEAVKFFPASAIRYYRNAKGNFTFKVQKPVEYLNSKDAFFKDYDGGSITKNTKTIDLNIEEKRSYGIDKVQELYNRFNTDKTSKALADRVFNIAKDLGLRISFDESLPFGTIGRYSNNNSIVYKKSFFERNMLNDKKAPIILHEMLHTLSMYALSDQTKGWRRPEALEQFRTEINSLYQDLKDNPILKGERGVTDVNEFVAELANPVFRAKIQNIDRDSKAAQKNEKNSFWSRIVDAFKSLLGLHVTNTYYQRSMNALDKALSSFDVDTYIRYNGIKNTLRQGYNAKDWEFNSMSDEQLKSKVEEFANSIKDNNQYFENKNNLQYEAAIKSAGRIFESTFNLIGNEQQGLGGSSKEKAGNSQSLRKQLHEESSKQQKELISWATKNKQLVVEPDDFYEKELGESLVGSETRVWRKGNNVVKSISLNHYGTPKALMERILIHNIAFPNTAMTMQKVGTSDKGMSIIVEQPLIIDSGTIPTMQEIEDFMIIQGFTHTKGQGVNAEYSKDDYIVTDIRPENVIKQPDGILAVIDCFAMFKNVDAQKTSQSTLQEFISSLSGKDLKDELSTIKQEYADYNLVNGIEEEKKHSGKAVPQDFTFADGTTIKAPFRPNAQQVDALNEMDRFMKSSETTLTLSGYAGTGKTSLMEMIAKKATMQGGSVQFCASTNKAAAVLNERVSKAGFKATTLNKLFGINVEVDMNGSSYNAKNLANNLKDPDITPGTTVIIDEASMINEENYHIINGIAKRKDLQIIYVGDEAQLAPVGETQTSKVFRNGDGKVIRLTQVERTADNAILKEATDIRNGKSLSGESSFNSKGEGVAYVSPSHQNAINDVVEHYVKGLKSNPNHFRILAYSNKAVAAYNKQVRDLLGYDSPAPHVGEPMMGYAQWGYDWRDKSYRLTNSESYRVTRVDKPKTVTIKSEDGHTLAMEAIPVTMVDSMGKVDTFNYIDVKNNTQNREVAKLLSEDKQFLWQRYRQVSGRQAKAEMLARINAIDDFLFINDNIEDGKGNLLSKKVIDFGYAMTVHKSQGSTFTHVLLDDVDIARFSRDNSMSDFETVNWDDVEMGNDLTGTTFDDNASEEVDFGLGTDTSASAKEDSILNQSTPQTINKRQQLEYVGVSRATDTVTVISNNVKKEGSPLHPEQSIKEDETKAKKQPTIPEQLISHLKSQGINVKDRAAMAEFLKTHKLEHLQQYINKYDLPKGELSTLSSALMTKYGNNTAYGDIMQTANYEYTVNYKGAGEYDIIEYHQIDNNIKNDYYDRKNEGFSEYADERAIQNDVTRRKYNSDSFNAEDGESNGNNAGLDKSAFQGKSQQVKDNDSSSQNQGWSTIKRDSETGRVAFIDGDGKTISTVEDWKGIETFTTSQGEVYGFVDKDGNIYLDETKISPEHPIHEYTHLWDRTVQQKNPKLWQKGVELMKQTSLWNEIFNDANYGKQWQSMNLPQEKLDNLIASEVHARFTGEGGEQLLEKLAKEKGQEGIIEKLKQWILDVWKDLKATFGSWSQEELDNLTLKDFNHMTVRDFTEGINLKEASNATYTKENTIKKEEAETNAEQPSLAEGTAQMVSLPGYEYYRDLYTDTPVDAEWKVSYLKELDVQLSLENPEEENQNILNQMDKLLEATSEEEYKQDSKKDKKNLVVVRALAEHDKIVQQLNDLLENKDLQELECPLTAQEIRHVAEQIANQLSDLITQLQEEEGLAQFQYKRDFKLNFQTASRKKIVETVGINNMIYRAKRLFEPQFADYKDTDTLAQAIVITQNWDAMMYLAADVFAMNEGFGITKDYSKKDSFTTTDAPKIDTDNFNDYSNDPDYERENGEKDEQEHWQVEQRTIDVLNSMSALVRQGIHECFVLDKNGNKVFSRWQIAERVNPRAAVNSLLRWAQGSSSLGDMVAKLSAKQANNPWLSQLITRLSDKSGKEADFQSQFYGVFSKPFQAYSIVLMEDGKYKNILVNSHPALSEAMKSITAQFRVGEHPLFTEKRINGRLLGTKDTVGESNPFNFFKARHEMERINTIVSATKEVDEATAKKVIDNVLAVCRALGYMATEDMISEAVNADNINTWANDLRYITDDLTKAANALNTGKIKSYDPFKYYGDFNISKAMREFLAPVLEKAEDTAVNAFYDSGKMYQSYVTPSFMTKLMDKFKYLQGDEFREFIMKEYGFSEWFKSGKRSFDIKQGWRNRVLQRLANDENTRKAFDHKVELNFNKHNYMRNMSDQEYTVSLITEFFAEDATLNGRPKEVPMSWYRVPMQSNKPSSEFIKLYSYRGTDYKENVTHDLYEIFLQELSRIQTVKMRNLSKNSPEFIKNFDSNGKKFCFLPVLNSYLENTDTAKAKRTLILEKDGTVSADNNKFAELLQKKVEGMELTNDEEAAMIDLAQKAIRQSVEERVQSILDNWEKNGILEAAKKINGIYSEIGTDKEIASSKNYEPIIQEHVRQQVETFLWNDTLMSKNILLLTIGDIAFYKDAEDLQKRLAQLHAPGVRGNADAIDYKGNRVSDGNYRTVVLKDFDNFKSNLIANITEVFDRKIERAATPERKKGLEVLKDSLVRPRTYNADGTVKDKGGKYWNINVADAQGFSSPSSYRKKAFIFGRWSKHAEDIYQKLAKGEYNYTDLEAAFQPLKPFVYSRLQKNLGVAEAPIHNVQVPFQAKNAEYLLIMADALLKGEKLSRPNLLRAVYRVMEDSEKLNPTKGIDTVQFESAIKSGLQGRLDIAQFRNMEGGEEAAYTYMMEQIYKPETDGEGKRVYQNYNTDVFVHETSYDNYCLQQEVPEHFKQHSQAHGSQIRMITPSDLDLYTYDTKGNQIDNYYEWDEPDGTHRKVKADEFKKEYEETIAKNIEESIDILSAEFHLDSNDKKERNLALSRVLQNEIMSSPRYGIDLLQACTVDKETGDFRIPKGDPIQAKRIEQLINSIIKNRVNKQKIAGGPIVQVSNFGTSQQLHIRFTDKSKKNGIIPLEEEYNPAEHNGKSYKDYIKENQGGIAYFEVFAPIWDNELFDKFADENGNINVDVINAIDPELLKMVSYRIPTEDKYSCAPMKVVGFMPREAGDAIMLPYELTEIDDSDFDVDKRYVMRKDIPIKEKNYDEYTDKLEKKGKEIYKEIFGKEEQGGYVERIVSSLAKNPKAFPKDSPFRKALFAEYQKLAFSTEAPISGRFYRDNKIIDMTYAVLTNEMTADKILNPGGFDAPKKMGYMVAAYKNPASRGKSWTELQSMSIDELKDLSYTDKDLTFADTQVQFYKQNSAAASLIGVFAVNKVAHAVLEGNSIFLDVAKFCGELPFTIADTVFEGRMQVDAMYDQEGNLIGKTLGSLVSASADAVKDPILNLMNVNMTTAGMLNTMLRLGMPFNDAALFLSQDIIERLLNEFNRQNLTNHEPLDNIIKKWLDKYEEKNGIAEGSNIKEETLSREELVKGLTSEEHEATDYKVLLAFQKLRSLTEAMRKLTFATRFNSISSAVGPLIVDNLILEQKMQSFLDNGDGTGFYASANPKDAESVDINTVFSNHPILYQFARTVDIAKGMTHDMPTGSEGFRGLLRQLPSDLSDKMFRDKKLLDEFSTFYQSYLLIKSGVVDSEQLSSYVDGFPQWFMKQGYKEKYSDNALIQAIKMNVSKKTGKPFLTITITGMDEQQKEELRSAWTDLHRADPTLSKRLFDYSFFRAGIGFSPKTFMSLVPTYVKERLQSKDGRSSYVDTYRHFPNTDYLRKTIIDQFVRNNWNNTKLVPIRGGEDTKYNVDLAKGTCKVYRDADKIDVKDLSYMKTKIGMDWYLWKRKESKGEDIEFERIEPLGNNGEYLEISLGDIKTPLDKVSKKEAPKSQPTTSRDDASVEDTGTKDLKEQSPQEAEAQESPKPTVSDAESTKKVDEVVDLLIKQNPALDKESAKAMFENIKSNPRPFRRFLQNVFKHKDLELNETQAVDEFKKYC